MTQSNKSKPNPQYSLTFAALGTEWVVESSQSLTATVQKSIIDRIELYDKAYSRFRDDSIVAKMAKNSGTYVFPNDFPPLFELYKTLYGLTNGQMTPIIGRALEQAGYDKTYSLHPGLIEAIPALDEVLKWDGETKIKTMQPVVFDVGAAGKGYAVDIVANILKEAGINEYAIDASGDIRIRGEKAERVGLENPYDQTKIIGVADVHNKSLCASASNRRAWRGMHHIMSPRTLKPVDTVIATWVVANDTMTADGLATALFFVDSVTPLFEHFDFSYVRIMKDGTVDYSRNFEGELFT
ncbi:MAG TPA: FAD:protein FMN transferase [Candidatus Saccharimonadales bacterium]|nr:FAD:protein FMN transferase [Candidatus Saccharimonadales bacterium]